jgi:hypothetical protein
VVLWRESKKSARGWPAIFHASAAASMIYRMRTIKERERKSPGLSVHPLIIASSVTDFFVIRKAAWEIANLRLISAWSA